MNFTLRPYQLNFVSEIAKGLKEKGKIIACAATGSGKTKTFVYITHQAIKAKKTVLILTESRKIFKQINEEFDNVFEINAEIKDCIIYPNAVYVAMVQTLANRKNIIDQFNKFNNELIIINDEAHIGTSTKLLNQLYKHYLIGFTATPRWKEAKHLTEIYKDIVIGKQPQWLIENDFLSPYHHFARVTANLSELKIKNGEFDIDSQKKVFEKAAVYKGIYDDLTKFKYYKCLIFCSSKEHADSVGNILNEMGLKNAIVHTSNPNADYDLFKFQSDPTVNICVSVGMLTKGYDFPEIDLIILNRATTSLPLYLQMCGRGSRKAKGKDKFTVIDYGGNGQRLGLWNTDRDWSVLWCEKKKPKEKEEIEDLKSCPECGFITQKITEICPACGHQFVDKPKKLTEKETILIELTDKYNIIRGRKILDLSPNELVIYRDYTQKKSFCLRVARKQGKEFLSNYAKLCGYSWGYMVHNEPNETLEINNFIIK